MALELEFKASILKGGGGGRREMRREWGGGASVGANVSPPSCWSVLKHVVQYPKGDVMQAH